MGTVKGYKMYVSYAVYAAEQVLDIYEKKHPTDDRPRKAIEAAKKCIKSPTKENKAATLAAAYAAAYDTAAADAAYAAAAAAAYDTAAYATLAVAYAADAAGNKMKLKILKYGIKLLRGDK